MSFAYRAWNETPWKDRIPKEIFLNDVLPYASINERRDDWRQDFYSDLSRLVAEAQSPAEAAMILNRANFQNADVRFSRKRPKADQSPYETIEAGMASCTGLSVLLIDACRAVGVPARLRVRRCGPTRAATIPGSRYGTASGTIPAAANRSATHWIRHGSPIGPERPSVTTACMRSMRPATSILTQTFPLVWNRDIDDVYAVNVTIATQKHRKAAKRVAATPRKGPISMWRPPCMRLISLRHICKSHVTGPSAAGRRDYSPSVALTRRGCRTSPATALG